MIITSTQPCRFVRSIACIACALLCWTVQAGAASGARLPDGTDSRFLGKAADFREKPTTSRQLIEWVGWQDAERAWEAAGVKLHRARNLLFRRNVIRHMRYADALWLDVGNSNSRITANVFADVLTVSTTIHKEVSLATSQIDNNIIWDVRNAEPGVESFLAREQ